MDIGILGGVVVDCSGRWGRGERELIIYNFAAPLSLPMTTSGANFAITSGLCNMLNSSVALRQQREGVLRGHLGVHQGTW